MKITKDNIHFVAHRLRKVLSNGFTEQHFYPVEKRQNSVLRNCGIEIFEEKTFTLGDIEKSYKFHVKTESVYISDCKEYIVITGKHIYNDLLKRRVFIRVGNTITINRNNIKIIKYHPTYESNAVLGITPILNMESYLEHVKE